MIRLYQSTCAVLRKDQHESSKICQNENLKGNYFEKAVRSFHRSSIVYSVHVVHCGTYPTILTPHCIESLHSGNLTMMKWSVLLSPFTLILLTDRVLRSTEYLIPDSSDAFSLLGPIRTLTWYDPSQVKVHVCTCSCWI